MRRQLMLISAALMFAVTACASSAASRSTGHSPDLITSEEIASASASNTYEAITRLRPTWFRSRGTATMVGGRTQDLVIAVYLDGQRLGDVASLRMLGTANLASIQWLDAARASTILSGIGSEPIAGAIVIKSR